MLTKTDYAYKILYAVSWLIFVGVCIEAGGFIFNTLFTLWLNPIGAKKFWMEINLSELYNYNQSYFVTITSLMIIVALLRALLFYSIIKNFHDKKINFTRPFSESARRFVLNIAYLALGIGLFSFWGAKFATGFIKQGINMPDIQQLRIGGADVWLFMGITLLVVAQIFKKGIELQNENDLTV